MDDP
jgi:hypothetical protein